MRIFGDWPEAGVAFAVRRGSFVIPAELFDEGRESDLARYFAQRMPPGAKAGRREKLAGGSVRLHWRTITVVGRTSALEPFARDIAPRSR